MSSPQFTIGRATVWLLVTLGIASLLVCVGAIAYVEVPLWLTVGWVAYLIRVVPEITVSWPGVGMAAATLAAFAVGLHLSASQIFKRLQPDAPPRAWRKRWTAASVLLVVMMFVSGIGIVGVAHQVAWLMTQEERWMGTTFQAAQRAASKNNLRQIGLALHYYHDEFERFVPGGSFDATGRPLHSWETHLLPYVDHQSLYEQIDLSRPWTAAENAPSFQTIVPMYLNPGIGRHLPRSRREVNAEGFALSHYAANIRLCGPNRSTSINEITDGTSNTLMAGEIISRLPAWGDPVNWRDPATGINTSPHGFGSPFTRPFTGGAQFLFADGAVRFLSNEIDSTVPKALSTPAGGEILPEDSW